MHKIFNTSNLETLSIISSNVSGNIPAFESMSRMTSLILMANPDLHGSIPPKLCALTKLRTVALTANSVSGTIPPCLARLTALTSLDVMNNNLSERCS